MIWLSLLCEHVQSEEKWLEQLRSLRGVAYKRMQVRGVIFPEQETTQVFLAGTIFGLQTRAQNRDPTWVTTYCFYTVGPRFRVQKMGSSLGPQVFSPNNDSAGGDPVSVGSVVDGACAPWKAHGNCQHR